MMRNIFKWIADKLAGPEPHAHKVPVDPVFAALREGKCPDCGGTHFLEGPQGGGSTNIECADCGADFNICDAMGGLFFAERIGWNRSDRWEKPGVLRKTGTEA